MTYSRFIFNEVMKTTLLSCALFTLYDMIIQGYSPYHNWLLSILSGMVGIYYLIHSYYSKNSK